jgi:outer membrane protein assembly factor BamB
VGILLVVLMWLGIFIPATVWRMTMVHFMSMMWAPIVGAVAILIWWLAFSRFPWSVRWVGLLAFLAGPAIAVGLGEHSMMMLFVVYGLPLATTVFVLAAAVASRATGRKVRLGVFVAPALVWGIFALLRMNGLDGEIGYSVSWRWTPTSEQRYLASMKTAAALPHAATAPAALTLSAGDWPGFRGPNRDGKLVGTSINADWAAHPPKLVWRHPVGPGWSSFCVIGDNVYTQEQRGEMEVVVCYDLKTGVEIWNHQDQTRFEEAIAGPGPRATPTFADGKLYAFGARGRLNCLNAATGDLIWTRDVLAESAAPLPMWGFSASPLVSAGLVTVITGGKGKSVMAYNADTGQPAWAAGDGWSFASTQMSKLDGVPQLLCITAEGLNSFEPQSGKLLWHHDFPMAGGASRITQPVLLNDNDVLIGSGFGIGTRRIRATHNANGWKTESLWTSRSLKPYYNDMVLHKDFLYGFDGSVFVCIDPATGTVRWRAHGYGNGQVLLIADQDLLLILGEQGEAALVRATPESHQELSRFQALNGKTWNHPVIAHGRLLVRNGEEAACYDVK